jgi:hypothetical protein
MFIRMLTLLDGASHDNVSYAYRQEEKNVFDNCVDVNTMKPKCTENQKLKHMCNYGSNHPELKCTT